MLVFCTLRRNRETLAPRQFNNLIPGSTPKGWWLPRFSRTFLQGCVVERLHLVNITQVANRKTMSDFPQANFLGQIEMCVAWSKGSLTHNAAICRPL